MPPKQKSNKRKPTQSPARHRRMPTPPPPPPPSPPPIIESATERESEDKEPYRDLKTLAQKWGEVRGLLQNINGSFLEDNLFLFAKVERQIQTLYPDDLLDDIYDFWDAGTVFLPKNVAVQTDVPTEVPPVAEKVVAVAEAATQTIPRSKKSYAAAATSTNNDAMEVDPPSPSTPSTPPKKTPPPTKKTPPTPLPKARAIVVHGVTVASSLSDTVRRVEKETRRVAMGARWLLAAERRVGKKASSVVVFFYDDVAVPGSILFGVRRHKVEVYEWGRANRVPK